MLVRLVTTQATQCCIPPSYPAVLGANPHRPRNCANRNNDSTSPSRGRLGLPWSPYPRSPVCWRRVSFCAASDHVADGKFIDLWLWTARDLTLEAARDASLSRKTTARPIPPVALKKLLDSRREGDVLDGLRRVLSVGSSHTNQALQAIALRQQWVIDNTTADVIQEASNPTILLARRQEHRLPESRNQETRLHLSPALCGVRA